MIFPTLILVLLSVLIPRNALSFNYSQPPIDISILHCFFINSSQYTMHYLSTYLFYQQYHE